MNIIINVSVPYNASDILDHLGNYKISVSGRLYKLVSYFNLLHSTVFNLKTI
jgi:hypothetical protein